MEVNMVKAELKYRDFNNLSETKVKYYDLLFEGDDKTCMALSRLRFKIEKTAILKPNIRVKTLDREIYSNDFTIEENKKRIELIKAETKSYNLVENVKEIIKLQKEIKYLTHKNKIFKKHVEYIVKKQEQDFYKTKNLYRKLLEDYGFVCTETRVGNSDVNIEIFESTLSDQEIIEKAKQQFNNMISLELEHKAKHKKKPECVK